MGTTIITTGLIINQTPQAGATNPHECHSYSHQVEFTDDVGFHEHLEWLLEGGDNIPKGIKIDSVSGLISGAIEPFNRQPATMNLSGPQETIKQDGSNCRNIGRFEGTTFTFNFIVKRKYLYLDPNALPTPDPETGDEIMPEPEEREVTTNVSITVIKSHDVDNLIFMFEYLKAGHPVVFEGKTYDLTMFPELIEKHPGPFSPCGAF